MAMDRQSGGLVYSQSDPSLQFPYAPSYPKGNFVPVSPYLNFDPTYITQNGPEFIFPEGASRQRGRFELAFSQIGGSVMIGALLGGANGFYTALQDQSIAAHSGSVRRTQILNYITKRGAGTANTLGVIAVMYSGFGVLLSWARGKDDELNTVISGTATGLLYKSSAGLKRFGIGGLVGFSLATIYSVWSSRDRLRTMLHQG